MQADHVLAAPREHEPNRRTVAFRAAQADDRTVVSCHAVKWGSRNSYAEIFVPGAFAEALAHRDMQRKPIVMGLYHDRAIGSWSRAAREDEDGLYLEGPISKTRDGQDAAELVRDGALTGVSVGFFLQQYEFGEPGERKTFQTPFGERSYECTDYTWFITKADLAEASLVMAPSDDEARVLQARSALAVAATALPALRAASDEDVCWEDAAYSMALLMGARGAGQFSDLPAEQRRALHARLAAIYKRHGRTAPDFTPTPTYRDVPFQHDEREVFQDRSLAKRLADVAAGAAGVSGPLSAGTRQAALDAVNALTPLIERRHEDEQLAALAAALHTTATSLKEQK
jgi:HK97 family phage prohead protease